MAILSTSPFLHLTADNYFDDLLYTNACLANNALGELMGTGCEAEFTNVVHCYTYYLVPNKTANSFSRAQIQTWLHKATVCDLQEYYCNVYKDEHGVRPRFGTPDQWADIGWLKTQIKELIA